MFQLTQRQINYGVFGLTTALSAITLVFVSLFYPHWEVLAQALVALALSGGLWFAYWRGWDQARYALLVFMTVVVAVGTDDEFLRDGFNHVIYAVPAMALVLAGPLWVLGSALAVLAAFVYRIGALYLDPLDLITFLFIIGGMTFSRLAVDNAWRLEAAKREAEEARAQAEQRERDLVAQAAELARRNAEQQRLLELVATLETPVIRLAEGILLAPLVGALDERRAQALTTRLLQEVSAQRARRVILDISGVPQVDDQVALALGNTTRALELLGCQVVLTGVSASVALTLTHLGITLEGVTIARSPQEALGR
ncbi:MAG: STAS domain-containing protein [Oscillochloridaceae bacterium]|nr:STAS domain-containing protein [Chloroflexaceae bacterium]MDW8392323.1 STAS domain-containing protein [Oscillochloridaceae bacterium]